MTLLLLLACVAPKPPDDTGPGETGDTGAGPAPHGVLNLHIVHNLADDACLADQDCALTLEEVEDVQGWVDALAADSDGALLHWDMGVPWSVFAEAPPEGEDAVAYYEARLDPGLVDWIHTYAAWFEARGGGFLALSLLGGTRDMLADERLTLDTTAVVGRSCAALGPDATFTTADGHTAVLGDTWVRWARFLAAEVGPDRLALGVELNLYEANCPAQWSSLVDLYRYSVDTLRPELPGTRLFGTLTLPQLLGWDPSCVPEGRWTDCGTEPPEPAPFDAEACFPGDPRALDDLAEGGRMDLLALSFYPDGLGMAMPGEDDARLRAWLEGTDPSGDCDAQMRLSPWVDPLPYLDRLGWEGPIAFAETSARSCPTLQVWDDGSTRAHVELPGSETGQVGWMEALFAEPGRFEFVNQTFERDYPPLGFWVADEAVVSDGMYNLLNTWPCSGLRDADGAEKPVMAAWRAGLGR